MIRILATAIALALVTPVVARAQDSLTVVRGTAPTAPGPAANFTGTARVGNAFRAQAPARVYGATVAFEPGARTHWHVHPLGQTLVVTAGTGRVQHWGGPVREVRPGDVVLIPPGVKHWHGASPDTPMTHVALVEDPEDGPSTEWMEAVTADQYATRPPRPAAAPADSASQDNRPSRAQQLMGDIAPMLAELTDDVLYGQVWASPELSPRDRSLVTVSALIALNRPDQLRSHLAIARRNGVTQEEAIALITHLAFYAGWPNAVTAVGVARQVFEEER
jgi:4-carboxymuconolactone decarboxylase